MREPNPGLPTTRRPDILTIRLRTGRILLLKNAIYVLGSHSYTSGIDLTTRIAYGAH